MRQPTDDSDWLYPDTTPNSEAPRLEDPNDVIRVDERLARGIRFETLSAAMKAGCPLTQEAVIYGRDGMLAECDPSDGHANARWVLLTPGHARLAEEANRRHAGKDCTPCAASDLRRSA